MNGKLTGGDVLIWLAGFFGLILLTNIVFVTMAVRTFRGEDEQHPYLQGIQYNQTLAQRAEQVHRGWQASISASRLPSGVVRTTVLLVGPDKKPQDGVLLAGLLRHPADENLDRPLQFQQIAPGRHEAVITGVRPGNWDVLVFSKAKPPFHASRRLWVP